MQRKPRVIPVSIEAQTAFLSSLSGAETNSIPMMLRNQQTGWPLLQVSYLIPTAQGQYEPALGGGKCHFLPVAIFAFAALIANLSGKREISSSVWRLNQDDSNLGEFNLSHAYLFLSSFHMQHKKLGVSVQMEEVVYGKQAQIDIAAVDDRKQTLCLTERLHHALSNAVSFYMRQTAAWDGSGFAADQYDEREIWARLNRDYATFYNGQIYVDLGLYLQSSKIDARIDDSEIPAVSSEIMNFLSSIFKVKEFDNLAMPEPEYTTGIRGAKLLSLREKRISVKGMQLFGDSVRNQSVSNDNNQVVDESEGVRKSF